jgi:hypothetical protein
MSDWPALEEWRARRRRQLSGTSWLERRRLEAIGDDEYDRKYHPVIHFLTPSVRAIPWVFFGWCLLRLLR